MEEITPELVARIASRLYNRPPDVASSVTPAAAQGATPMATPSLPSASAPSFESVSANSPVAGIVPSVAPMAPPTQMPVAPTAFPFSHSTPGVSPSAAGAPVAARVPTGEFASTPSAPGFAPPSFLPPAFPFVAPAGVPASGPAGVDGGLRAFVAQIRQTHLGGGAQGSSRGVAAGLRERLAVGRAIPVSGARPLDVAAIRKDFPILQERIHGKPLAWFDNAATTQKPQCVIDALSHYYSRINSNIHRGAHTMAARSTEAYEQAREKIQKFIGAGSINEIVLVRGTTEGINLVAQTYGRKFLQSGDEILLSQLEHHANIVPWQMVAKERGATLRVIPVNDRGEVLLDEYHRLLGPRTRVVALTQASNSLGTILPVAEMTQMAKRYNARVLIDGAQSVAHIPVNMQQLGADFFVFSGHKIFGPTGIGAVYVKEELHDILPPWQGGGNMIKNVTFEETTFSDAPAKFEAGTPNIADAVGLGAALDYVSRLGLPNIAAYEHELLEYATAGLTSIPGLRLLGTAREKVGVLSFVLPNRRTEDVGRMLDQEGIAVRSGHHCSQPSLRRFGVESSVRPSLAFYNTKDEIDRLVDAVRRIRLMA